MRNLNPCQREWYLRRATATIYKVYKDKGLPLKMGSFLQFGLQPFVEPSMRHLKPNRWSSPGTDRPGA